MSDKLFRVKSSLKSVLKPIPLLPFPDKPK